MGEMKEPAVLPPQRFRFSLRQLLFWVLFISVLMGLILYPLNQVQRTVFLKHRTNSIRYVIDDLPQAISNSNGAWPRGWNDIPMRPDIVKVIEIDFTLTLVELQKNPDRIYNAIRVKDSPEVNEKMKPKLARLRDELLAKYGTAQHAKLP